MSKKSLASRIIDAMYENDFYSQWLGIKRLEEGAGYSKLQMTIRKEMCNGFGIAHGGISFSFADSALAFACNSQGRKAVSIETSISHVKPIQLGDIIIATAREESLSSKIGVYKVEVHHEDGTLKALFKGTVYRTSKKWLE